MSGLVDRARVHAAGVSSRLRAGEDRPPRSTAADPCVSEMNLSWGLREHEFRSVVFVFDEMTKWVTEQGLARLLFVCSVQLRVLVSTI